MMRYKVVSGFKGKTPTGELELRPGQVVRLSPTIAAKLMDTGKVKAYCYWLQEIIEECQYPCFLFNGITKVRECKHFSTYWKDRLKVLDETK